MAAQLSSAAAELQDAQVQLAGSQAEKARLGGMLAERDAAMQQLQEQVKGLRHALAEQEAAVRESKEQERWVGPCAGLLAMLPEVAWEERSSCPKFVARWETGSHLMI
jgi:hypothetical protein